jgi:heme-degrading monooxygenase HmoA
MYIRMVWGKLRPGAWGEYERHYHERVAGSGNIKGLRERQLLRSTEDPDEGISVSLWDTLEDLRSYETGEFRQTMAQEVEYLYRGEYWVRHFEISATDQ